jgi:hypothetical protein
MGEIAHEKKKWRRTEIPDELLCVVVDQSTFLNGLFDRRKIGISKDHVGCELRDVSSAAHSDTDVCLL